jgi:hypothetical protein
LLNGLIFKSSFPTSLVPFRAIVGRPVRRIQIRNFRKKARKANRRSIVVAKAAIPILSEASPRPDRVVIGWPTDCLSASIFNQFHSIETNPATTLPIRRRMIIRS